MHKKRAKWDPCTGNSYVSGEHSRWVQAGPEVDICDSLSPRSSSWWLHTGGSARCGCIYSLTHLLPRAWVSIPVSLRCRFNWAVKLFKGKMRNDPVSPRRQWAGSPQLRRPTLTPSTGGCREDWAPSAARQTPSGPTGPSASFPVPETRGLLEMQIKISSSCKLAIPHGPLGPSPVSTV